MDEYMRHFMILRTIYKSSGQVSFKTLLKKTGWGEPRLRAALTSMTATKLLIRTGSGKEAIYEFNTSSAAFKELVRIMESHPPQRLAGGPLKGF